MFERIIVKDQEKGLRLDKFLSNRLKVGLRGARRLILNKKVFVNFKSRLPNYRVRPFDEVVLGSNDWQFNEADLKLLYVSESFFAVEKPAFIHTSKGSSPLNVENLMDKKIKRKKFLLNRLDYLTSGIIIGCFNEKDRDLYKQMQDEGRIEKYYVAVVKGFLRKEFIIKNKIDDRNRKKVKVLKKEDDPVRFSWVKPLKFLKREKRSIVLVKILKGRRHQIRAHLSYAGYPIVGDYIYGEDKQERGNFLFLHHCKVVSPLVCVKSLPSWYRYRDFLIGQFF